MISRRRRRHLARLSAGLAFGIAAYLLAGRLQPGSQAADYRVDTGTSPRAFVEPQRGADGDPALSWLALGSERRFARATAVGPAGRFDVEVRVTAAAAGRPVRLRFAYGVLDRERAAVLGGLAEKPPEATEFFVQRLAGAKQTTRFRGPVGVSGDTGAPGDPGDPPERWREGQVEIAPAPAGTRHRFRFGISGDVLEDDAALHAYWADLRVEVADPKPRSVLLVSIDTLRADRLSLLGRRAEVTTPRLDAWARRRATLFADAVAASPWTLPSHASIFSGVDALRHGVNHDDVVDGVRFAGATREVPYLAERARDAGLRTGAATSTGMLAPQFGFAAGFDVYRWWPGNPFDREEIRDGVARTLAWFRAHRDTPTLFFLHTYRVHSPFARPVAPGSPPSADPLAGTLDNDFETPRVEDDFRNDRGRLVARANGADAGVPFGDLAALDEAYDHGVRAADEAIGELLETLEREGLDRDLTVLITSDHGEALGENGRFGHHDLHEATLAVPLLLAVPGGSPRRVERMVRHVDLMPTLLEALGLPAAEGVDGVSLLPFATGGEVEVPAEARSYSATWNHGFAVRRDTLRWIVNDTAFRRSLRPRVEGFDRARDPLGARPVAPEDAEAPQRELLEREVAALRGASGLWFRFRNRESEPLRMQLTGPILVNNGVKSALDPGLAVNWVRQGEIEVTVAPRSDGELRLDHQPYGDLGLARIGSPLRPLTLSAQERAAEPTLVVEPSRWTVQRAPLGPGQSGVELDWRGPVRRSAPLPHPLEVEPTETQLRALGYLE